MTILTKAIYRFNADQITTGIFHRTKTKIFTICMEIQKTSEVQSNLKKKRAGEVNLHDFRLYYKATVIKQYGTGTKTGIYISGLG